MRLLSGFSVRLERKAYRCVYLYHSDGLGEENQAEETKERIIQKMKDKTDTIIDEALEPTEIQNF